MSDYNDLHFAIFRLSLSLSLAWNKSFVHEVRWTNHHWAYKQQYFVDCSEQKKNIFFNGWSHTIEKKNPQPFMQSIKIQHKGEDEWVNKEDMKRENSGWSERNVGDKK